MKTKGETPRSPGGGGIQKTWLVNGFRYYRESGEEEEKDQLGWSCV